MEKLWTAICSLARFLAWVGGAMIMIAALIVSTEVICRKLLAFAFSGSDEIGAYLFAVGKRRDQDGEAKEGHHIEQRPHPRREGSVQGVDAHMAARHEHEGHRPARTDRK